MLMVRMVARRLARRQGGSTALQLAAYETDDILDSLHGFGGDRLRALRTVGQDRVDMDRVLNELLHFRADWPELGDREVDQCRFEGGELPAAKLAEDFRFADPLQRRVDAHQVVGLGARRQSLF